MPAELFGDLACVIANVVNLSLSPDMKYLLETGLELLDRDHSRLGGQVLEKRARQ